MDYTLNKYRQLLESLSNAGYEFYTLEQYLTARSLPLEWNPSRIAILRHDVDKDPDRSLMMAQLEAEMGIQSSYYFRCVKQSNHPSIIHAIADLDHEIGYHYEDMSLCHGDIDAAVQHFTKWLNYFRNFYNVRTICMHGAPTSKYDSRELWKKYDYHQYGIIGEPYYDIDYSEFFYLTDTGRRWDGYRVSLRDKIPQYQDEWTRKGLTFHTTDELINADLPAKILITTHPQRWTDNYFDWTIEYISQSLKNIVKRLLIHAR